jgi:hypothetical protein
MGEMADPTPVPETGAEIEATPYPLRTESAASGLAANEAGGTPAIPTPAPVSPDTLSDQQETLTQKFTVPTPYPSPDGLAEDAGDSGQAAPARPGFWTPLRLLEAGLALIALAAGAAAFIVRRLGSS